MTRFFVAHFLCQMVFLQGVVVHFFAARGFGLAEILLFKNMVFVALMVLQIPSGALADRFGRKTIMVTGAAVKALGCLLIALWTDIWVMAAAYLLIGAGLSLYQAGDAAYVYERTAAAEDPSAARRSIATLTIVATAAICLSTVLGGYVATYDLELVAWVNCVVAIGAVGVLATCDLDARRRDEGRKPVEVADRMPPPRPGFVLGAVIVGVPTIAAGALFYVPSLLAITTFQAFWNEAGVTALRTAQLTAIVGLAGAAVPYLLARTALVAGPFAFLLGGAVLLVSALQIGGSPSVAAMVFAALLFECLKAYAVVFGRIVLNEAVSDRHRGTWNSFFLWTGQTGVVVSGPFWGARIESDGRQALSDFAWFAVLAAAAIGAVLALGRFLGGRIRR